MGKLNKTDAVNLILNCNLLPHCHVIVTVGVLLLPSITVSFMSDNHPISQSSQMQC